MSVNSKKKNQHNDLSHFESLSWQRPSPPRDICAEYSLNDYVEVVVTHGWRKGRVTEILLENKYKVYFAATKEDAIFNYTEIRLSMEWLGGGSWIKAHERIENNVAAPIRPAQESPSNTLVLESDEDDTVNDDATEIKSSRESHSNTSFLEATETETQNYEPVDGVELPLPQKSDDMMDDVAIPIIDPQEIPQGVTNEEEFEEKIKLLSISKDCEVEVSLQEDGFKGSWFRAILEQNPTRVRGKKASVERPDGSFLVYFDDPPDIMRFIRSQLRPHADWIGSEWVKSKNKGVELPLSHESDDMMDDVATPIIDPQEIPRGETMSKSDDKIALPKRISEPGTNGGVAQRLSMEWLGGGSWIKAHEREFENNAATPIRPAQESPSNALVLESDEDDTVNDDATEIKSSRESHKATETETQNHEPVDPVDRVELTLPQESDDMMDDVATPIIDPQEIPQGETMSKSNDKIALPKRISETGTKGVVLKRINKRSNLKLVVNEDASKKPVKGTKKRGRGTKGMKKGVTPPREVQQQVEDDAEVDVGAKEVENPETNEDGEVNEDASKKPVNGTKKRGRGTKGMKKGVTPPREVQQHVEDDAEVDVGAKEIENSETNEGMKKGVTPPREVQQQVEDDAEVGVGAKEIENLETNEDGEVNEDTSKKPVKGTKKRGRGTKGMKKGVTPPREVQQQVEDDAEVDVGAKEIENSETNEDGEVNEDASKKPVKVTNKRGRGNKGKKKGVRPPREIEQQEEDDAEVEHGAKESETSKVNDGLTQEKEEHQVEDDADVDDGAKGNKNSETNEDGEVNEGASKKPVMFTKKRGRGNNEPNIGTSKSKRQKKQSEKDSAVLVLSFVDVFNKEHFLACTLILRDEEYIFCDLVEDVDCEFGRVVDLVKRGYRLKRQDWLNGSVDIAVAEAEETEKSKETEAATKTKVNGQNADYELDETKVLKNYIDAKRQEIAKGKKNGVRPPREVDHQEEDDTEVEHGAKESDTSKVNEEQPHEEEEQEVDVDDGDKESENSETNEGHTQEEEEQQQEDDTEVNADVDVGAKESENPKTNEDGEVNEDASKKHVKGTKKRGRVPKGMKKGVTPPRQVQQQVKDDAEVDAKERKNPKTNEDGEVNEDASKKHMKFTKKRGRVTKEHNVDTSKPKRQKKQEDSAADAIGRVLEDLKKAD
ncbi:hypothetical protein DY000_02020606 [Brassica cretica]|uniref:Agenet domain-containing protein n=1 Tax=Brassica cretica TaxID=69181 RepID=A0ABQ7EES8_BRACR|nr:hypothetical protein DY000_02020606 [Brassica cretica]